MHSLKKLVAVLALCSPAFAQFFASPPGVDCAKGGQAVVTQGLKSTATTPIPAGGAVANGTGVVASYPSCQVTVYLTGTTNKPTIYNDVGGSSQKANPFTANTDGSILFFAAAGQYDVTISGGGLPTPRTFTQVNMGGSGGGGGGGGGVGGSGTVNQLAKWVTPGSLGNSVIFDDGSTMTQAPKGLTVINNGYAITYPNSPNGTTNNLLAVIDTTVTTSSQVTTAPTNTVKAIGIIHAGGGTTGNSQVTTSGFEQCIFDNQTIVGDTVIPSSSSGGQCSDGGAVRPPATQGIGRVTTVNAGAGTLATVQMFSLDISAPGASGGSGTVSNCGTANSIAFFASSGTVVSCDPNVTDDAAGHVTAKSVGTTDSTQAGFMYMVQGAAPAAPPAGAIQRYAPTSVTAYSYVDPSAAGTGCLFGTNASNIVTLSFTPCAGSSYPIQVNGGAMTANDTLNFNSTTPAAGANTLNIPFTTSRSGTTDSIAVNVSITGNTSKLASSSGSLTSGHNAGFDASGNIVDNGAATSGTVTSVATTSPITGGTITSTGTIACATCVTSAASLTNTQLMAGAGGQASQVTNLSGDVTTSGSASTTVVKINGGSVPASKNQIGTNSSSQIVAVDAYTPYYVPAANCVAGTAGAGWNTATSNFTAACRAGTNNLGGALQAIPNTGASAQFQIELPLDWDTATQPYIRIIYASGANTSGTVIWTVSSACSKEDGSVTDDPSFNAESAFASQTMAVANREWGQSGQYTAITSGNNCIAGSPIILKVALSGTATSNINVYGAIVTIPRTNTGQAE